MAEVHLRNHLAQLGWDGVETESPVLDLDTSSLPPAEVQLLVNAKDDFKSWATWQIRAQKVSTALRAAGASSEQVGRLVHNLVDGFLADWVLIELAKLGTTAETIQSAALAA